MTLLHIQNHGSWFHKLRKTLKTGTRARVVELLVVLGRTCLWRTVSDSISGAENCTVTRRSSAHWQVMSEGSKHVWTINCCIRSWLEIFPPVRLDDTDLYLDWFVKLSKFLGVKMHPEVAWVFCFFCMWSHGKPAVLTCLLFSDSVTEMEQFSGFVVSFWFAAGNKIIRLFRSCCFDLQLGPQPGSGFWIFEIWPQWSNSYIVFEVFEISICSWGQNYPGVLKFWGFDLELRSQ